MKILLPLFALLLFKAGIAQTVLTDPTSGCKYSMAWNCDSCTLSWTGSCLNNSPHGKGVLTVSYQNQEVMKYEGEMKNGAFDGPGQYTDAQNKLTGYFKNGNLIKLGNTMVQRLERNVLDLHDSTDLYINDAGAKDLFYYALPPMGKIKGTVILFPGAWEPVENVLNDNLELINRAFEENLMVVVPSLNYNVCLNEIPLSFLNKTFTHMLNKYSPPANHIVLGGFSLGGANAIGYTEIAYQNDGRTAIKPMAVYGVDPPLDYTRLYGTFKRTIDRNFSKTAVGEAEAFLIKMTDTFGGTPDEVGDTYLKYAMFSNNEKGGGNAKYLRSVPVRLYCDPDITWHLKERGSDYYDMNAVDHAGMINQLHFMGNEKAEFINALGKGHRSDGRRHPHSWSIVDSNACVDWILENIKSIDQ